MLVRGRLAFARRAAPLYFSFRFPFGFGPGFSVPLNLRNRSTSASVKRQSVRPSIGVAPDGRILPLASQRFSVASETPISWAARLVEYVLITTLMVSQYGGVSSSFIRPLGETRCAAVAADSSCQTQMFLLQS